MLPFFLAYETCENSNFTQNWDEITFWSELWDFGALCGGDLCFSRANGTPFIAFSLEHWLVNATTHRRAECRQQLLHVNARGTRPKLLLVKFLIRNAYKKIPSKWDLFIWLIYETQISKPWPVAKPIFIIFVLLQVFGPIEV